MLHLVGFLFQPLFIRLYKCPEYRAEKGNPRAFYLYIVRLRHYAVRELMHYHYYEKAYPADYQREPYPKPCYRQPRNHRASADCSRSISNNIICCLEKNVDDKKKSYICSHYACIAKNLYGLPEFPADFLHELYAELCLVEIHQRAVLLESVPVQID